MDIKQLIANVNIGLLEKSKNKKSHSKIFDTLAEAKYYQDIYGGNIVHLLDDIFEEENQTNPLDVGVCMSDDEDEETTKTFKRTPIGPIYYILNLKADEWIQICKRTIGRTSQLLFLPIL